MSGGAVSCKRAAEVVEALTTRKGSITLDPERLAMLVGGISTVMLQTQELLAGGLAPIPASVSVLKKCGAMLDVLGLTNDEKRAVFQAAAADLREAAS